MKKQFNSRQLNVIRHYDRNQFDYLIALIFNNVFDVAEAYKIPHDVIGEFFEYKSYQNGHIVTLTQSFISDPTVEDITEIFR